MLETYWLVAEGAAVAVPAAGAAAYAVQGRKRLHQWLREPRVWDGGQPVSLVTIFAELNGETDFTSGMRDTTTFGCRWQAGTCSLSPVLPDR